MAAEVEVKKESFLDSAKAYVADVRGEMKRVTWPSRAQVESTTMIVILSVFAFALFFRVVDYGIENTVVRLQQYLVK